ncbi:MAG TPA: HlyC/CorC family transporter, partial [Trichococcus sp.]|nr:HlyC/CorC family transporter [Trichococcus sp.]
TPIEFTNEEEKLTRDEMKAILAQSRGEGVIDPSEFTMMQGVLSLDTKLARELMVPRTDTLMMDLDDDLE